MSFQSDPLQGGGAANGAGPESTALLSSAHLELLRRQVADLQSRIEALSVLEPTTSATEPAPVLGKVEVVIQARARRARLLPSSLFSDPAWDILLSLYRSHLRELRVSTSRLFASHGIPSSTGVRWIKVLENEGLVERRGDPLDARRFFISLSEKGLTAMTRFFDEFPKGAIA